MNRKNLVVLGIIVIAVVALYFLFTLPHGNVNNPMLVPPLYGKESI